MEEATTLAFFTLPWQRVISGQRRGVLESGVVSRGSDAWVHTLREGLKKEIISTKISIGSKVQRGGIPFTNPSCVRFGEVLTNGKNKPKSVRLIYHNRTVNREFGEVCAGSKKKVYYGHNAVVTFTVELPY